MSIEISIDYETECRLQDLAEARDCQVSEIVEKIIELALYSEFTEEIVERLD